MKEKIIAGSLVLFSLWAGIIWSAIYINMLHPWFQNFSLKTEKKEIIREEKFTTITDLESEITQLVKEVGPSVVNIIIKKDLALYRRDPWWFFQEQIGSVERQVGWGSWFFVTKDGIIMTNKHVVADSDANYTVITNDGTEYEAKVVALDPLTDLAIIKIENTAGEIFQTIESITDEDTIQIGQFAIAIWNALWEFQNSVAFWVISGKNRAIEAWDANSRTVERLTWLLQTDAAINPWNSGWPLINIDGKLMWVNTAIAWNGQWLGFSIPMSQKRITYILESIEKYWEIKRPFIGISYIPINPSLALELWLRSEYGAYVPEQEWSIQPWSSAQRAGIEHGDIILSIDGNKVDLWNPLQSLIQNKIPWDTIEVNIIKKDGSQKNISLTLGEN